MILRLDKENYDLWLTYSWSANNHGLCGHTYEVIDYYLFLKEHMRVGILLCEDIDWPTFRDSVVGKYIISDEELVQLEKDTLFVNRPNLVHANNILFTDGGAKSLMGKHILAQKIFHFACGDKELQDNDKDNVFILQDARIYRDCKNSIDYKKRINFERLKKPTKSTRYNLLYGTKNCRNIPDQMYLDLLDKYDGKFMCLTNKENRPAGRLDGLSDRFDFPEMPVADLFEKFDRYIYTPVPRKFDCSPRMIAECKFFEKEVVYYNIDYWDEDKGLYWRKWDIDNDFESIFLKEGDPILEILGEHIGL